MYCLGHKKLVHDSTHPASLLLNNHLDRFVSAIHIPSFAQSDLISGGGDPVLKIWHWMTGIVKHEIHVLDAVQPYIKVRSKKRKRGDVDDDIEVGRGKGERGKGKGKAAKGAKDDDAENEESSRPDTEMVSEDGPQQSSDENGEWTLVVHKIDTVASDAGNYIVFNAIGYVLLPLTQWTDADTGATLSATALFTTPYPADTKASSVRAFDLGRPVIDFNILDHGLIWVSVDANWPGGGPENLQQKSPMIRILKLSSGEVRVISRCRPIAQSFTAD
jgi:tRNA (guanine-N(7)-)-methyltransferase subunit TRM82